MSTAALSTLRKLVKKSHKRGDLGINDYQVHRNPCDYTDVIRIQFQWNIAVDLTVDDLTGRVSMKLWHIDKGRVLHPHALPDSVAEETLDDTALLLERASDIATQLSSPRATPRPFPSFEKTTYGQLAPRAEIDHSLQEEHPLSPIA